MSLNEWGTHTRVQPVHRERQNADRNKKGRQKDEMQPENDEVTKGQKWLAFQNGFEKSNLSQMPKNANAFGYCQCVAL